MRFPAWHEFWEIPAPDDRSRLFKSAIPHMSILERWLFKACIRKRNLMVEFGAGASTLYAFANGVKRIVSVEPVAAWIAELRADQRFAMSFRLALLRRKGHHPHSRLCCATALPVVEQHLRKIRQVQTLAVFRGRRSPSQVIGAVLAEHVHDTR